MKWKYSFKKYCHPMCFPLILFLLSFSSIMFLFWHYVWTNFELFFESSLGVDTIINLETIFEMDETKAVSYTNLLFSFYCTFDLENAKWTTLSILHCLLLNLEPFICNNSIVPICSYFLKLISEINNFFFIPPNSEY